MLEEVLNEVDLPVVLMQLLILADLESVKEAMRNKPVGLLGQANGRKAQKIPNRRLDGQNGIGVAVIAFFILTE